MTWDPYDKISKDSLIIKELQHDGSIRLVQPNGDIQYIKDNLTHRVNGPAIITARNTQIWYYMGKRHRLDGPAVTYYDGYKEWWVDNVGVTSEFPQWAKDHDISYPFNLEQKILFKLIWES